MIKYRVVVHGRVVVNNLNTSFAAEDYMIRHLNNDDSPPSHIEAYDDESDKRKDSHFDGGYNGRNK